MPWTQYNRISSHEKGKEDEVTNLLGYVFAFDHDIGEGCFEESVPSVEKNASQSEWERKKEE